MISNRFKKNFKGIEFLPQTQDPSLKYKGLKRFKDYRV